MVCLIYDVSFSQSLIERSSGRRSFKLSGRFIPLSVFESFLRFPEKALLANERIFCGSFGFSFFESNSR